MSPKIACIKGGKLLIVDGAGEPREIESQYAENVRARERQIQQRHAWKTQGSGARFMAGGASVLWGQAEDDVPLTRMVGVARGRKLNEVFYAISTGIVSGIFGQSLENAEEHRLFHDAETQLLDLSFSIDKETFACTVAGKGGSSAIAILADDGRGVRTVTEGDVVDRAPRWVPSEKRQLVYSSAGIGRTQQGHFAGLGPFAVHRLTLGEGSVEVIVAEPAYDYLAPVALDENTIYAVRRPYRDPHAPPSFFRVLGDALLAPFRILFALFGFLSFFTARYTGKPLLTSGNARQKTADARRMMVWGNLVDIAQQADKEAQDEAKMLKGYELVKILPKRVESVARGVLAFDLDIDGTVYYSTGSSVMRLAGGKAEKIVALDHVEQVIVL